MRRSMSMREFILAMGLYTVREMNSDMFAEFNGACRRARHPNYNPRIYFYSISTAVNYDTSSPPSCNTIRISLRHCFHRLIAFSIAGRHSGRQKVNVGYIYMLQGMDGGDPIDVPWNLAKFISGGAKGFQKRKSCIQGAHLIGKLARGLGLMTPATLSIVTRGQECSMIGITKLCKFGICRLNGAGEVEMEPEIVRDGLVRIRSSQATGSYGNVGEGHVRQRPIRSIGDRLLAMDDRMGDMEGNISHIVEDIDEITAMISGMNIQYDGFYGEFRQMQ